MSYYLETNISQLLMGDQKIPCRIFVGCVRATEQRVELYVVTATNLLGYEKTSGAKDTIQLSCIERLMPIDDQIEALVSKRKVIRRKCDDLNPKGSKASLGNGNIRRIRFGSNRIEREWYETSQKLAPAGSHIKQGLCNG